MQLSLNLGRNEQLPLASAHIPTQPVTFSKGKCSPRHPVLGSAPTPTSAIWSWMQSKKITCCKFVIYVLHPAVTGRLIASTKYWVLPESFNCVPPVSKVWNGRYFYNVLLVRSYKKNKWRTLKTAPCFEQEVVSPSLQSSRIILSVWVFLWF